MEYFGIEYLVGIPKWATYNDLLGIVDQYIAKLKNKDAKIATKDARGDYYVRLLDPSKVKCIFCMKEGGAPTIVDD